MMRKAFADYSEDDLTRAIKANWADFFRLSGRFPQAELDERPDLMRFSCAIPWAFYNGVFRTKLAPNRAGAAIEETIAFFESRGVPAFSWWLMPDIQPADMDVHLASHGFVLQELPTGMAIDLESVDQDARGPAGLRIQVVREEVAFGQWSTVCATCFGMTDFEAYMYDWWMALGFDLPLRLYLGLLNGEPVATSAFYLDADVAGIYCLGVLPDARKQGIGTAMMLPPLLDARELGYRVGILQAAPMGYNLYRRLGFQEYCKMSHYVWKREPEDVTTAVNDG